MSSSASLSSLPPELFLNIFGHFCDHCCTFGRLPQAKTQGKATLLNLCLTSKNMSAVATTVLYHNLPPLTVPKFCRLLSNILSKPQLANSIYLIKLDSILAWETWRTVAQQRDLLALFERLELDPSHTLVDYWPSEDDEDQSHQFEEINSPLHQAHLEPFYYRAIWELLTRARNLKALEIRRTITIPASAGGGEMGASAGGGGTGFWGLETRSLECRQEAWQRLIPDPAALSNLRTLHINIRHPEDASSMRDTECRLGSLVLAAAGRLEHLSVWKCQRISLDRVFPSITSVDLEVCWFTSEAIRELIVSLPALRRFAYESGGDDLDEDEDEDEFPGKDDEHTPADVARHLRLRRSTLTSVSLRYDSTVERTAHTLLGSFSDFPVLESMSFGSGDVFGKDMDGLTTDRLVSILPSSLKKLLVRGDCPASECLSLAAAAAAGQFPVLEEVEFGRVLARPANREERLFGDRHKPSDVEALVRIREAFGSLKIRFSVWR